MGSNTVLRYNPDQLIDLFSLKGKYGSRPRSEGDELVACCPFPHVDHRTGDSHYERNPSFAINLVSGKYNCFSCQRKGPSIDSLAVKLGVDLPLVLRSQQVEAPSEKTSDIDLYSVEMFHRGREEATAYLRSRGIVNASDIAEKYYISSTPQGIVQFPVIDGKGTLQAWLERSIADNGMKYIIQPENVRRNQLLYGLHAVDSSGTGHVFVVESTMDVLTMADCELPAVGTVGAAITELQIELLLTYFSSFTIIPQNDIPGKRWAEKLAVGLSGRAITFGVRVPARFKDLSEIKDCAEINRIIGKRRLIKFMGDS